MIEPEVMQAGVTGGALVGAIAGSVIPIVGTITGAILGGAYMYFRGERKIARLKMIHGIRSGIVLLLGIMLISATAVDARERGGHSGGGMSRGGGGGNWSRGGGGHRGGYHRGYRGGNDLGGAIIGGVIGGMFGNWFSQPEPQVIVVPEQRDVGWCVRRYRSYDTYTRTYLGYDGLRHGCP